MKTLRNGRDPPRPITVGIDAADQVRRIFQALGLDPNLCAFVAERLVDPLADVMRFRKAAAVDPGELIADLETGILDRAGQPMIGARAAERDQVAARLQHAEHFAPEFDRKRDGSIVPLFPHEPFGEPSIAISAAARAIRG